MGTCCFGNRPSEKFIGVWTDNKYVQLTINQSGNIVYQKQVSFSWFVFLLLRNHSSDYSQTEHTNARFAGPTRFKDNEFFYCCCCCCLRGKYNEDDDTEPKLIANGAVLTKKWQ